MQTRAEELEVLRVGRKKIYTEKTLRKAVNRYFASITQEITLTEKKDTGRKDKDGHAIYETVEIKNALGEPAKVIEYLVPPSIGGLCIHLGIVASTWTRWKDAKKYPEFEAIVEEVQDKVIAWRKEQVVIRKDVKGLIWDLEVNFGCGKHDDSSGEITVVLEGDLIDYAE